MNHSTPKFKVNDLVWHIVPNPSKGKGCTEKRKAKVIRTYANDSNTFDLKNEGNGMVKRAVHISTMLPRDADSDTAAIVSPIFGMSLTA